MGQKVHPIGIRLGITKDWTSKWYADSKTYPHHVYTDHLIRSFLKKRLSQASVSRIQIERPAKKAHIQSTRHDPVSSSARKARTSKSCGLMFRA